MGLARRGPTFWAFTIITPISPMKCDVITPYGVCLTNSACHVQVIMGHLSLDERFFLKDLSMRDVQNTNFWSFRTIESGSYIFIF